jgi:hypothetical protein
VYLERGTKRVFAGSIRWPGWARSGRDEASALEALARYGRRYASALGRIAAAGEFRAPDGPSDLRVAERLTGNASTDFGVPALAPKVDGGDLRGKELDRQRALLQASWRAFDRAARAASGKKLTKGPRGGGRELAAIVRHVMEAESAYLAKLGGNYRKPAAAGGVDAEMTEVRRALLDLLESLARGEPPPRTPRSGSLWTPRYAIRRSAWHALDHAWEIEDRAR